MATKPFYSILTRIGMAKEMNASMLGQKAKWSHMGVGDGNGAAVSPDENWTSLINEVYRGQLNQLYKNPLDETQLIAEMVIPVSAGGFWVREIAIYDEDGDCVAVGSLAPMYKPTLEEGSVSDTVFRTIFKPSNVANIQLKIDPTMVLASQDWVIKNFRVFPATEALAGIARIATEAEVDDGVNDDAIITPKKLLAKLASALGNYRSSERIAESRILTADDMGKVFFLSAGGRTSNVTVTLPPLDSVPGGARIKIIFAPTASITKSVVCHGSDSIWMGGVSFATLSLSATGVFELTKTQTVGGYFWGITQIPGLGEGQTWQNMAGQRAVNTNYTNTTGRPLLVIVGVLSTASNVYHALTGSGMTFWNTGGSSGQTTSMIGLIPPGGTYQCQVTAGNGTLQSWYELKGN